MKRVVTRRVVVAMREREGRTLPFIAMGEGEGVKLAIENVSRNATMSADEASHRDTLHDGWMVDRVNHSEIYSDHGKHTNMVESFFSRLRNMIQGQHHGVSPKYLHQYANHSAWLEDKHPQHHSCPAKRQLVNLAANGGSEPNFTGLLDYWITGLLQCGQCPL
jgi:hypothetical protein